MDMKRRAICLLLVACLLLALVGCGRSEEEKTLAQWQLRCDMAARYMEDENYSRALILLDQAIALRPDLARAYLLRAQCLEALGRLAEAVADEETVLELEGPDSVRYLHLAELLLAMGEVQQAREVLEQAVEQTGDATLTARLEELQQDYALEDKVASLHFIQSFTTERKVEFNEYTRFAPEEYTMEQGVLACLVEDFDHDGEEELFTAESVDGTICYRVYCRQDGAVVCTDSVVVNEALFPVLAEKLRYWIYTKEVAGTTVLFFEYHYHGGAGIGEGDGVDLLAYEIQQGKLVCVMDEAFGTHGWREEGDLDPFNAVLEQFGLAPVEHTEGSYNEDVTVAIHSEVEILAYLEQSIGGSVTEFYPNEDRTFRDPEEITPLVLRVITAGGYLMCNPETKPVAHQWIPVEVDGEIQGLCYESEVRLVEPVQVNDDQAAAVYENCYLAWRDEKVGLIDLDGNWVVEPEFDKIEYRYDQYGAGEGQYLLATESPMPNYAADYAIQIDGVRYEVEWMDYTYGGRSHIDWDVTHQCFVFRYGQSFNCRLDYTFQSTLGVNQLSVREDLTEEFSNYYLSDEEKDDYFLDYQQVSKYRAIATNTQLMTDFVFEDTRAFTGGLMAVKQNGKWGYADANGDLVIPCQFCGVRGGGAYPADVTDGYVVLFDGQDYALYDTRQGKMAIPFGIYDKLTEVYEGRLWAKYNGQWGVITLLEETA